MTRSSIPNEVPNSIKAGISSSLFAILLAISFASLIFTGKLAPYLTEGFGLAIVSTITLRLVLARYSEIAGCVPSPFVVVCLFIAMQTHTIAEKLDQAALQNQIFPTSMAVICLSTLSIAVTLVLLGRLQLGNFIRYLPYPVICGVLAGIGLSMALRGISVILETPYTLQNITAPFTWSTLFQIALGLFFAFFIVKFHSLKMHGMVKLLLFLAIISFYAAAYHLFNTPTPHDWFFGPISPGRLWPPALGLSDFALINWPAIADVSVQFVVMNAIFIISYLVNVHGMETFLKRDVNINRELQITGIANFVTLAFGGIGGCLSASQTIPNILDGGTHYLSTVVAAIITAIVLLLDASMLQYVPKGLIGSVSIYLGALFVYEWAYKKKKNLPITDFLLLLAIMFLSVIFGFLEGLLFGVGAGFTLLKRKKE